MWDRGSATVRELAERLYQKSSPSQHATVQKLLERLEGKECVVRDRTTWPHTFAAAIEREELIGRQLQQTPTSSRVAPAAATPHLVKTGAVGGRPQSRSRCSTT
jgi:predicted transcriptional regulator